MDCFNVITAVAGGMDKVKLIGIYSSSASNIPSWKLGIVDYESGNPLNIVCPGRILYGNNVTGSTGGTSTHKITFEATRFTGSGQFTVLLFTW